MPTSAPMPVPHGGWLSDYDQYPNFVPDLAVSHVVNRGVRSAVVEQRGEARFLFYLDRAVLASAEVPCLAGDHRRGQPSARVRRDASVRLLSPVFPDRAGRAAGAHAIEEPGLAPQSLPRLEAEDRIALYLESGTHYLQRVVVNGPADAPARRYDLVAADRLPRLPHPDGVPGSLFGPGRDRSGQRAGRALLLWPRGLRAPGAMRQWPHHATAFVGRRHFDDPYLIERYFLVE